MRRDYFELDVRNVSWVDEDDEPAQPSVTIDFDGPESTLITRLTGHEEELLTADEIDVAFRLQGPVDDPEATGVVSVTNRLTGDFVLELNEDADDVIQFIRAAREYGESEDASGHYHVTILIEGEEVVAYEKNTFLVYNEDGNLLRKRSLIPSGVEL